jgi:putative membrane protein
MSVLPIGDLAVMRQRVFARRAAETAAGEGAAVAPAPADTLLRLPPRELMLYGFIENRGLIVVSAAFGLLWEAGILDGMMDRVFGDEAWGRGVARDTARAVFGDHVFPVRRVLTMLAAFAGFLIVVRLLSMAWAAIRLHDFTLTRSGDDLQTTYGLLTRVTATVPLRRVQAVTIREGPLHRWTSRVSVRVVTAGGVSGGPREGSGAVQREWLAPIVARGRLPGLLHEIAPGFDLAGVEWRDVHPRAFRREVKGWLAVAAMLALPAALVVGWWDVGVLAALGAWSWFAAGRHVAHLHWALTDVAVLCRKGWLWRYVTLMPLTKIQAVTRHESPFDRRTGMGRVIVDAAGAGQEYRVDIPYLPRETAHALAGQLTAAAARTAFKW